METIIKAVVAILNVFLDRNDADFGRINIDQFRNMRKMVNSVFDMVEEEKETVSLTPHLTPQELRMVLNIFKIEGKVKAVIYVKNKTLLSLIEAKKFTEELAEYFPEISQKKDNSNQE